MKKIKSMIAVVTLALCSNAQSASITYTLDQSNVMPDGIIYLKVTISDSTVNIGDIDFTVDTTSAFTSGVNFGIQSFGFNPSFAITSANIYNLNSGWKIGSGSMGGFGSFGVMESGTGNSRQSPLTFSIRANGDTIDSYANPSSGTDSSWVGSGNAYFTAHVAGFTSDLYDTKSNMVTSAYFAGSTTAIPPNSIVPVPAAAWLLGSGLIGLVGVARRENT